MSINALKRRVKRLEDLRDKKLSDVRSLTIQVDDDQSLEDLTLARLRVDAVSDALDKAKDDLKDAEVVIRSSDYKLAVKRMDAIKADNEKTVKAIDETVILLVDLITGLQKTCQDYDRLKCQVEGRPSVYGLFTSYGWITLLKAYLDKLSNDLIYQMKDR